MSLITALFVYKSLLVYGVHPSCLGQLARGSSLCGYAVVVYQTYRCRYYRTVPVLVLSYSTGAGTIVQYRCEIQSRWICCRVPGLVLYDSTGTTVQYRYCTAMPVLPYSTVVQHRYCTAAVQYRCCTGTAVSVLYGSSEARPNRVLSQVSLSSAATKWSKAFYTKPKTMKENQRKRIKANQSFLYKQ